MDDTSIREFALKKCIKEYGSKQYKHFDRPLSKNKMYKELKKIRNPRNVPTYRHLPFITFNKTFRKYTKYDEGKMIPTEKRLTKKTRTISLASHHDSLLLKYYSVMLSTYYEQSLNNQYSQLKDSVIAYRSGKSNILGAKSVFDYIWKTENCWIIKGDFKAFFDNLNHTLIFNSVKKLLNGSSNIDLDDDWYSVLKFITKYRTITQKQLKKNINSTDSSYVKNRRELSTLLKNKKLKLSSINSKGIPQGTALSAILANVYMLDFDNWVLNLLQGRGIYRRYSDDFVIILPNCSYEYARELTSRVITNSKNMLKLDIEPHKTKFLYFSKKDKAVYKKDLKTRQNLDYLGFEFNGQKVFLRSKSFYKFKFRGKHAMYILKRLIKESSLIKKYNNTNHIYYLENFRNPYSKKLAKKRLANLIKQKNNGINLQFRKRIAHLYLSSNIKHDTRTMLGYACRAQDQLSAPISGISGLYEVVVEKQVRKQIFDFGLNFHEIREINH